LKKGNTLSNWYLCYRFEALRLKKGWLLLAKSWLKTKMKILHDTAESRKQRKRAFAGQSRGWKVEVQKDAPEQ
jgi:hypothetical protein